MKKPERSKSKEIDEAAKILKAGGVVIFPTDTVYGIGCIYDDPKATKRLRQIKGTPASQDFPILVSSISQAARLARITPLARELISKYWPGALTIILPSRHPERKRRIYSDSSAVPRNFASKTGFRMPDSNLIKTLIEKSGAPIIGTSANFHGQNTPQTFEELDPKLIKLVDYALKGQCKFKIQSTVVDVTGGKLNIIRQGAVFI